MAVLIPELDLDLLDIPHGEVLALQAFEEALGDDTLIFHHLEFVESGVKGRRTAFREGEVDILILDPRFGMLIVEVKGGLISYQDGQWFTGPSGQKKKIKNPFEQARRQEHFFQKRIEKELGRMRVGYGYAVCFPQATVREDGLLPTDAPAGIILDQDDITDPSEKLGKRIVKLASSWDRPRDHLDAGTMKRIVEVIRPEFRLVPSLRAEKRLMERRFTQLTEQQAGILQILKNHRRVCIKGPAGSGKTMLALEKFRQVNESGKEALLICFTEKLISYLQTLCPEYASRILNFHSLCEGESKRAGIPFSVPEEADAKRTFYVENSPLILMDALEKTGRKVDAVIVDEAQDFEEDWWTALQEILIQDGELCVFLDDHQNLFQRQGTIPITPPPYDLNYNCRNTKQINSWLNTHCDYPVSAKPEAPEGSPPDVAFWKDYNQQNRAVERTLKRLLEQGYTPDEMVVLTPYRPASSHVTLLLEQEKRFQDIQIHSIMSYKGLESDVVLLCDLGSSDFSRRTDLIYTAASRARMKLFIFSNHAFKSFFKKT